MVLPSMLVDPDRAIVTFAKGYAHRHFAQDGWTWIEGLRTDQWPPDQLATLATVLPDESRTWRLLDQHGDQAAHLYWESINFFSVKEPQDLYFAVSQLIARHRPFAAVHALSMAVRHKSELPADLILQALEATLLPDPDKPAGDIGFSIIELLQDLQKRDPPVDETRIGRLEWAYINLLDGEQAAASTLHHALVHDAKFFSELLRVVFRPRGEQAEVSNEPSEETRSRAMNAYRLLRSLDTIPGFQAATGAIDGDALYQWIVQARELPRIGTSRNLRLANRSDFGARPGRA